MKIIVALALLICGLSVAVIIYYNREESSGHPAVALQNENMESQPDVGNNGSTPVLVELFTSQGCSSCPPADEVLARLVNTQPIPGVEVIALSEHVDYWNYLGWTDPYSSELFSQRQQLYAGVFKGRGIYTPQMVVDGQYEFVGSRMNAAQSTISKAAQAQKAKVYVTSILQSAGKAKVNSINLSVRVENLPDIGPDAAAEVLLAVTESKLRSSVTRGENAGRYLQHTAVVRQLISIGNITKDVFSTTASINLAGDWKRENLKIVVFVQERVSRRVLGAASINLSAR